MAKVLRSSYLSTSLSYILNELERIKVPTIEHKVTFDKAFEGITNHVKRHKVAYSFGAGVAIAGITCVIMRGVYSQHIGRSIGMPAQGSIGVLGVSDVNIRPLSFFSRQNVVTVIEANRQGPPSWVVRCKETLDIFPSQNAAAKEMGLARYHLSDHLNGARDHVNGFTFERICMAA
jgi:hypothetical protein